MTELFVKKIRFNYKNGEDHESLDVDKDQIVVFVGPNNAGKSQALRDIYSQLGGLNTNIVVNSINLDINHKENLEAFIRQYSERANNHYQGADFTIYDYKTTEFVTKNTLDEGIRNFLSKWISTEDRLKMANAPENINPGEPRKHPLHYFKDDERLLKSLSDSFHKAFGEDLQLNLFHGRTLPLVVGDPIRIQNYMAGARGDENAIRLRKEYQKLPLLENQGDGMRSLAGILLYLHVPHYSSFFIDEPESFLHTPQAYIMGQLMTAHSAGKQLFIATHSEMLLKGLIDSAPDRVKIVRITRSGNLNTVSHIDKNVIQSVWDDPLLKYSNIMDALFYPATVICESNADCKFYRMIFEYEKKKAERPADVMFVECSGKQRMHIICSALGSLNIEFRALPDFDLLRKDSMAKELYNSCGGDWDRDCADDWAIIDNSLPVNEKELKKSVVEARLREQLNYIESENLSRHDISNLKDALKGRNKWDGPKHSGIGAIKDANAKEVLKRLMQKFEAKGIYLVPCGEMEDLIRNDEGEKIGGHGKDWLENLLKTYPDLDNVVYDNAKAYINSLNL